MKCKRCFAKRMGVGIVCHHTGVVRQCPGCVGANTGALGANLMGLGVLLRRRAAPPKHPHQEPQSQRTQAARARLSKLSLGFWVM